MKKLGAVIKAGEVLSHPPLKGSSRQLILDSLVGQQPVSKFQYFFQDGSFLISFCFLVDLCSRISLCYSILLQISKICFWKVFLCFMSCFGDL